MNTRRTFINFLPARPTAPNEFSSMLVLSAVEWIILKQTAIKHTQLKTLPFTFCNPKINHTIIPIHLAPDSPIRGQALQRSAPNPKNLNCPSTKQKIVNLKAHLPKDPSTCNKKSTGPNSVRPGICTVIPLCCFRRSFVNCIEVSGCLQANIAQHKFRRSFSVNRPLMR